MESHLSLLDYKIGHLLWRHADRAVYHAKRLSDNADVMVETIDAQYPERQSVASLRREAQISEQLADIVGVQKVHSLLPHGSGNLVTVSDYYDNTLVNVILTARQGLPVAQVLTIALTIVETLSAIHQRGIIHKSIAPQHVLYNTSTCQIALAGLAYVSELEQERQSANLPAQLKTILPYMSPEHTGRMNRDLDYRSDYYSLGVLLFELLTGKQPFDAVDALEWVYHHICSIPKSPKLIVPEIPEMVGAIVLKLLAKCPEERYQNAESLKHDLQYCLNRLNSGESISSFELGSKGKVQQFLVPQSLYGREKELAQLLALFEQAVQGANRFCLVHGYSGVGKSVLVNEIDKYQVRERGFLVQSKFDQFHQSEAYAALAATYRALVQQVLQLPEHQLEQWRKALTTALSPNASLVIDLVPELELIIGKQPSVVSLPPAEARNRQHMVLAAFLNVFAGEGHPVVLFLDDLHWSDIPTLELLRRIVTSREQSHLLLIAAYRSNEVTAGHPLQALLNELDAHNNIHYLPVEPLESSAVSLLVSDSLGCTQDSSAPLTELLFNKAKGNPFFTNELLRQLHKQGAISADIASGQWQWDMATVNWQGVSDDVVQFMLDNLKQLPEQTQHVLQLAACIGAQFSLKNLAAIYQRSLTETALALIPALKQQTIQPLDSDYHLISVHEDNLDINYSYRFQHDRVQQAAYQLIDKTQLPKVHLSIGKLMLHHLGQHVPDDKVSDIVGHMNHGVPLINDAHERELLAQLNIRAGKRAKNSSAYNAALEYLSVAQSLLPDNAWDIHPEIMNELASEIQQCYYLTGATNQADEWIDILLARAPDNLTRSDILATRTRQYATVGRMQESIASAIQGLALLNIDFTENPTDADIAHERELTLTYLAGREIADLVDADEVTDPAILVAMRLLMEIFAAAFLSGSGKLFPYLVLKSANLSLRHGNSPESAFAYAAYGMLLCGELDEPALGYQYGKVGLAINEKLDDLALRARVVYVYAMFVHHWSNHWATLTPLFRQGIEAGYQTGDLLYLAYSAQDCVIWDPTLDLETAERLHAENLAIVKDCAYQDSLDSGTLFLQMQRNFLGKTHDLLGLSDNSFDRRACLAGMQQRQFMTGIANHHIYSAEVCVMYGEYDKALEFIHEQDKLIKSAMSLPQLARYYLVANLTLATHYSSFSAQEKVQILARLNDDLARMTRWADNCEDNFRHLQYLMAAEIERISDSVEQAMSLYDLAAEAAKQSGFLRDEAYANERAARHLLNLGKSQSAEGYLRAAYKIYDRWGAKRKVENMLQEFPVLRELVVEPKRSQRNTEIADLDLASVMKASREISGEIVLDKLLKRTMTVLLENAGAQWGCLVVRRDDGFIVETAKLPENQPLLDVPDHMCIATRQGDTLALPMTVISEVYFTGNPLVLHEASTEGQFIRDPYIVAAQSRSVLCVPVKRERFDGVLFFENNLAGGVFTQDRVEIIHLLAAQASVAIENARLYEQVQEYSHTLEAKVAQRTAKLEELNKELQNLADRDGLTNVANRRRGDTYLQEVWLRLRREEQPMTVIMFDVDHFKLFNDNYGHQAGDECLKRVASAVQSKLHRVDDLIARYGGEEFMLILPNTDRFGAMKLCETVRETIESLAIVHEYSSVSEVVTVSVGSATVIPTVINNNSIEQLVHNADMALYKAKQMGRNRVHLASI